MPFPLPITPENVGIMQAIGIIKNPDNQWRIAASGGLGHRNTSNSASFTRNETRREIVVGGQPLLAIKLVYANIFSDPSGDRWDTLSNLTLTAALEMTSPVQTVPCTFGGSSSIVLAPGDIVESDPIFATAFTGLSQFAANLRGFVRTGITFTAGSLFPACIPSSVVSQTSTAAGSQVNGTGAFSLPGGGSSSLFGLVPIGILGLYVGAKDYAVIEFGDSIMMNSNDATSGDLAGTGGGAINRGLYSASGRMVPHAHHGIFGRRAVGFDPNTNAKVVCYLARYADIAIENFGTNDDSGGTTAAQTIAARQYIWSEMRARMQGAKYISACAILPRIGSTTDSYATAAGQTPRAGFATGSTFRDPINNGVQALVGQPNGPNQYLNWSSPVQDPGFPDRWISTGAANYATNDGTHPSSAASALMAPAVTGAVSGWPSPT